MPGIKLIPTQCPKCGAGIDLYPGQGHCLCAHCGTSFVVESDRPVSLASFEAVLQKAVDNSAYIAANLRLAHLEQDIPTAQKRLGAINNRLATLDQNHTPLWMGLFAFLLFGYALSELGNGCPWVAVVASAILVFAAYAVHVGHQEEKVTIREEQRAAQAHLVDLALEAMLCQEKVAGYRYKG